MDKEKPRGRGQPRCGSTEYDFRRGKHPSRVQCSTSSGECQDVPTISLFALGRHFPDAPGSPGGWAYLIKVGPQVVCQTSCVFGNHSEVDKTLVDYMAFSIGLAALEQLGPRAPIHVVGEPCFAVNRLADGRRVHLPEVRQLHKETKQLARQLGVAKWREIPMGFCPELARLEWAIHFGLSRPVWEAAGAHRWRANAQSYPLRQGQ